MARTVAPSPSRLTPADYRELRELVHIAQQTCALAAVNTAQPGLQDLWSRWASRAADLLNKLREES